MSDQPKKRGGKRKGAGRKAAVNEPIDKLVRFEKETVEKVLKITPDFGNYVREATDEKLERDNNTGK